MVKSELQVNCWSQTTQIAAEPELHSWAWIQDNKFSALDLR